MIDISAFRAEEDLWALTKEEDGAGRNVVRRAGHVVKRFYLWAEAVEFLNDECLRASISASVKDVRLRSRKAKARTVITLADIEAARTPKGGWTKAQFSAWGISYPPAKGWKQLLVARGAA